MPFFSIITATYNDKDSLKATITSLAEQDFRDFEYIVIDGNSTDNTQQLLESNTEITHWISEDDNGVYDAWNKGLNLAKGEWVCFLGAGDTLKPGALSAYHQAITNHKQPLDLISSQVQIIDYKTGNPFRIVGSAWNWQTLTKHMCIAHPAAMHHKSLYERFGQYSLDYRIAGDYEFLLRAGPDLSTAFMPTVTVDMPNDGISHSTEALKDSMKIKISHGIKPFAIAYTEYLLGCLKFKLRQLQLRIKR